MRNEKKVLWYGIAEFILDNRVKVIRWLNLNNYANLPLDTPVDMVNQAIADNMLKNPGFIEELLLFQREVEEGRYSNIIVAIATAVSMVAETITGIVQSGKNRLFAEKQALRQEQYNKEYTEWQKEQDEINARKEIAIQLGVAQTDIILKRDMSEDKQKRINSIMIFALAVGGAIAIAFLLRKNKK